MYPQGRSRIMLIISMVIFGSLGVFVRHIGIPSGELALYRAVMAAVLIGGLLLAQHRKLALADIKKELPLLLLSGAALGFNWILLFEAYKYTTVSIATLSYYFAPVLVTVLCPILFKEKIRPRQWLCFGMSTLGLILITGLGDPTADANHTVGILFGLGAACLYATVVLLNKRIQISGLQRTFLQFLAAIIVLLPYVLCNDGINLQSLDGTGWICLLVVGLIHTGLAYCLYFSAIKVLPGQKTAILSYIDPLLAVVLSVTLLKEPLSPMQIAGGLLILGFTLYNELAAIKH